MIFIQAEKYDELVADVKAQKSYLSNFKLNVDNTLKLSLEASYETLIPIFKENKDSITAEMINEYLN